MVPVQPRLQTHLPFIQTPPALQGGLQCNDSINGDSKRIVRKITCMCGTKRTANQIDNEFDRSSKIIG